MNKLDPSCIHSMYFSSFSGSYEVSMIFPAFNVLGHRGSKKSSYVLTVGHIRDSTKFKLGLELKLEVLALAAFPCSCIMNNTAPNHE